MEIPMELIGIIVLLVIQIVGGIIVVSGMRTTQKHQGDTLNVVVSQTTTMKDSLTSLEEHVRGINGHVQTQGAILTTACADIGNLKTTAALNGNRIGNLEHRLGSARTRSTDK